jgi:hypothetical protein
MRVNLTVNESLVQYVQPGFAAEIRPVGYGDKVLHGVVEKVNQYAEPTSWRQANVKDYKAFIHISDVAADLRSGMTAAVTIHCADVPNAIQVPVQAMYAWGPKFYCFVYDNGKWDAREVKAGPTNDKFFVIESGLDEGEKVALNPRSYVSYVSLPKLPPEEIQRAVPQPASAARTAQNTKAAPGGAAGPEPQAGMSPGGRPGRPGAGGLGSEEQGGAAPGGAGPGAEARTQNGPPGEPGGVPRGPGGRRGPGGETGPGANANAVTPTATAKSTSQGAAE